LWGAHQRIASIIFDLGKTKESRQTFTRHLSKEKAMAYPWLRALILELRNR
jgi:hypothetical protein